MSLILSQSQAEAAYGALFAVSTVGANLCLIVFGDSPQSPEVRSETTTGVQIEAGSGKETVYEWYSDRNSFAKAYGLQ